MEKGRAMASTTTAQTDEYQVSDSLQVMPSVQTAASRPQSPHLIEEVSGAIRQLALWTGLGEGAVKERLGCTASEAEIDDDRLQKCIRTLGVATRFVFLTDHRGNQRSALRLFGELPRLVGSDKSLTLAELRKLVWEPLEGVSVAFHVECGEIGLARRRAEVRISQLHGGGSPTMSEASIPHISDPTLQEYAFANSVTFAMTAVARHSGICEICESKVARFRANPKSFVDSPNSNSIF
jgi:hypothetical protein